MKQYLLIVFALVLTATSYGQEFVEVSFQPSYSAHTYFTIADNGEDTYQNGDWDIAFTAIGGADAGIHINEAITSGGQELELWLAPSNVFDDEINPIDLYERLYNDEKSWEYGAFNVNELRNPNNPLDYGWGSYNPSNHTVEGNKVYAIKLRNGEWKKFTILNLSGGAFNLQWADLDGTNLQTASVNKQDYPGSNLVLFSLENNEVVAGITPFDLLFTRYVSPIPDGQGDTLDYTVTGVFSGIGIEVAEANGIDPETVQFEDYRNDLSTELDIIGQDWKNFNLTTFAWELNPSLAYFVVDLDKTVWKIIFVDFEGSSSGNVVFTKEEVGTISSVKTLKEVSGISIFPNPSAGNINVLVDFEDTFEGSLRIVDMNGKAVYSKDIRLEAGLINLNIDGGQLASGQYRLLLANENGLVERPVIIK